MKDGDEIRYTKIVVLRECRRMIFIIAVHRLHTVWTQRFTQKLEENVTLLHSVYYNESMMNKEQERDVSKT